MISKSSSNKQYQYYLQMCVPQSLHMFSAKQISKYAQDVCRNAQETECKWFLSTR